MLALDNPSPDPISVVVDVNKSQYILCNLQSGKILQQPLNLNFTEGEEIALFIEGDGEVHLTGILLIYWRLFRKSLNFLIEAEYFHLNRIVYCYFNHGFDGGVIFLGESRLKLNVYSAL